ncbi:MAG: hypothetical protein R6V40_00610 [Candidatus Moraniibacteriota bacterium]
MAHRVYNVWKNEGKNELEKVFLEMGIPEDEAVKFAENYNPQSPPAEVCPVEALEKKKASSEIFNKLSLQFPSIREGGVWPKNVLAWWILRYIYGEDVFEFVLIGDGEENNKIDFVNLISTNNGDNVPFGLAALEAVEVEDLPAHVVQKSLNLQKSLGKERGLDLAKTFLEAGIIFPPKKQVDHLIGIINRGFSGEKIIITGAFCPDYEYEETGDPALPYRYTFEGLNEGVGLVAQQFQRMIPLLADFFDRNGIEYEFHLGIGDFEADSKEILERVGVDYAEFVKRCSRSLENFQNQLPSIPNLHLYLMRNEFMNGGWEQYKKMAYERMKEGNFGFIEQATGKKAETEVVNFTAKASRKFYEQWYGASFTWNKLRELVMAQGSEYAALGRIFQESFPEKPMIQLAGDRPKMQAFNNFWSCHPTLCAKRVY